MIPTISQVCSLSSPLEKDIADYAAGHCESIEIWFTKLEGYLQNHSTDEFLRLLEEHNVTAHVASFQGGLLISQGERRRVNWDHFRRRLEMLPKLGVEILVVAADIVQPLTQPDLDRAAASLVEAADLAGEHGMRLALEFQATALCFRSQLITPQRYTV